MDIKKEENIPCIETAIGDTITFKEGTPMTFTNVTFRNLNIKGTIKGHKFINCSFEHCHIGGSQTALCEFENCKFKNICSSCFTIGSNTFYQCDFAEIEIGENTHINYNVLNEVTGGIKYCNTTEIPHGNTFINMCFDEFIPLLRCGSGACLLPDEYIAINKPEIGERVLIWGNNKFKGATLSLKKLRELCRTTEIIVSESSFFTTKNKAEEGGGNREAHHYDEIANLCIYLKDMPEEIKAALIVSAFNADQTGTVKYTITYDGDTIDMDGPTTIQFQTAARPDEDQITIIDDNGNVFSGILPKFGCEFKDDHYTAVPKFASRARSERTKKYKDTITMTAKDLGTPTISEQENVLNPRNYANAVDSHSKTKKLEAQYKNNSRNDS